MSGLTVTLLPGNKAATVYKAEISNGKFQVEMIATGPNGHLYPVVVCPFLSPVTLKDLNKNLIASPEKFSKNALVTITSPAA